MSKKAETFNPWSVVNLVFDHLVAKGLQPVLGVTGDPSVPATDLLRALGVEPGPEPPAHTRADVSEQLAELRATMLGGRPEDDASDDLWVGEATGEATQITATQITATQTTETRKTETRTIVRTIDKGR